MHTRPQSISAILTAAVLAFTCSIATAAVATFDFEQIAEGTTISFFQTNNGLSATFGDAAPGPFFVAQIGPQDFATLSGNILVDADNIATALRISFDQPINALTLDFATNGPGEFIVEALLAGTAVGSASAAGSIAVGFFLPEGTISFSATPFDAVRLSSTAPDFAIDNLRASFGIAAIAEPSSLLLISIGMLGAWWGRCRHGGKYGRARTRDR